MKLSLTLLSLALLAQTAHADNKDKADALFKQGKKLMGEKRYADACDAFEKSYKLDPGIGAQLNIAKCYEDWGKLGRALLAYQAAEKQAHDANDAREPKIHDLIVGLEPNVPHLTIKVPKNAPSDLAVTLDSHPVTTFNDAMVVDPGPHMIEWSVNRGPKKTKVVPIDRGGDSEVTLDVTAIASGDAGAHPGDKGGDQGAAAPAAKQPGRNQRLGGIALAGGGVVAVGISSYLALSARSKYNDALDMYCGGMKNNCNMTGLEITHDARTTANTATIVFVVGAAMVGGGVTLYLLAPKAARADERRVYVTPAVGPDGLGFVLGGTL